MKPIWNPPNDSCTSCYFLNLDQAKPYCGLGFPISVQRTEGRANYVKPQNTTPCLKAITALGVRTALDLLNKADTHVVYEQQCKQYNTNPNWLREDARNHAKRPLLANTTLRP